MKPTKQTYEAAILHIQNGKGFNETIRYFRDHFGIEIPPANLSRRWAKVKSEIVKHETGAGETAGGTGTAIADFAAVENSKNSALNVGNVVSEHSEQAEHRSTIRETVAGTVAFFQRHFSLMHLVFYTTTGTACFAIWNALPNIIGAALLTVFALFSLDSILKAQDGENPTLAEYGRNRVIASELVASIAHYLILNKYLWANRAALPFEIRYLPPRNEAVLLDLQGQMTNGVWQNGDVIFYISAGIAALLFVAAFAAVDSVLRSNKI